MCDCDQFISVSISKTVVYTVSGYISIIRFLCEEQKIEWKKICRAWKNTLFSYNGIYFIFLYLIKNNLQTLFSLTTFFCEYQNSYRYRVVRGYFIQIFQFFHFFNIKTKRYCNFRNRFFTFDILTTRIIKKVCNFLCFCSKNAQKKTF